MMNAQDRSCARCGRRNPVSRIWCEGCRAGLLSPPVANVPSDDGASDDARKRLYEEVLRDLEQLSDAGTVPAAKSSLVEMFYRERLAEVVRSQGERARQRSIHQLAASVRRAALEGRYDHAIELLQRGIDEHSDILLFQSMLSEVRARSEEERAQRASIEAKELVHAANQLTKRGLLEEAKSKLQNAVALDPSNSDAMTALKELEVRLSGAELVGSPESAADQEDADEEIPIATLVAPADAMLEPAETPEPVVVPEPFVVPEPAGVSGEGGKEPGLAVPTSLAESREKEALPVATSIEPKLAAAALGRRSFAEEEEVPTPTQRLIDSASQWSSVLKPFLLDNVGWFVGAFLVIAGFVVLIVSFWGSIEQNRILVHSIVYFSLLGTTGIFFAMAYFMRLKYPQLESSSNVLMVIVTLLIPLVFAAAVLTTLVPAAPAEVAIPMNAG